MKHYIFLFFILEVCKGISCSGRGTCKDVAGEAKCECDDNVSGDNCETLDAFYSDWSDFTACSETCGIALKLRFRNCTDLEDNPRYGCDGDPVDSEVSILFTFL